MAKGTLLASATSTKKGSVSSRAGTKNGKSNIIESAPTAAKATTKAAASTTKKTKAATAPQKSVKKEQKPATSEESDNDDDVQFVERDAQKDGLRHLDVKGKQYDKHYKAVVRDALEGMPLLYPDEQDKIETILKLFDLDPEYGPSAGMTRLERWQRAANWGLDPPREVHDILTTIEGGSKVQYRESLFYGRV